MVYDVWSMNVRRACPRLMSWSVSQMSASLMSMSICASVENEGEWFTSSTLGLSFEVSSTSKPRISKHAEPAPGCRWCGKHVR